MPTDDLPYIPYSCQDIVQADIDAVTRVLRSEYLTQGPTVVSFENAFAALHGATHAVAVANATAALHIGCLALGVGSGKRVWTSPISFLASANCALYCGALIDFVDIEPETRNMSVAALAAKLQIAAHRGELPHAVIPVAFAGLPCDLREMRQLADRYGFRILYDASHATGGSYLGRPIGEYADATVFSLHAVKIVTTAEGGVVTTDDAEIAKRLRLLRSHGMSRNASDFATPPEGPWAYEQHALGFNYRLTELQAALGLSQLSRIGPLHRARIERADRYDALLGELPLLLPARRADRVSAWHLYAVEIDDGRCKLARAELFAALHEARIGANVHYIPIHTQPYYQALGFRAGDFPDAERYYARALSIPLFPALTDSQQDRVVDTMRRALAR